MKIKISKKGKKTTVISIIATVLILALFVALFLEKITGPELKDALIAIGTLATLFIGFFSKDQDQSHTQDN